MALRVLVVDQVLQRMTVERRARLKLRSLFREAKAVHSNVPSHIPRFDEVIEEFRQMAREPKQMQAQGHVGRVVDKFALCSEQEMSVATRRQNTTESYSDDHIQPSELQRELCPRCSLGRRRSQSENFDKASATTQQPLPLAVDEPAWCDNVTLRYERLVTARTLGRPLYSTPPHKGAP